MRCAGLMVVVTPRGRRSDVPAAEDLWDADFAEAVPQSGRAVAASQTAVADLLDQPGARNGRKRQTASAPAAGRKGGAKRPRAEVRSQPSPGEAICIGSLRSNIHVTQVQQFLYILLRGVVVDAVLKTAVDQASSFAWQSWTSGWAQTTPSGRLCSKSCRMRSRPCGSRQMLAGSCWSRDQHSPQREGTQPSPAAAMMAACRRGHRRPRCAWQCLGASRHRCGRIRGRACAFCSGVLAEPVAAHQHPQIDSETQRLPVFFKQHLCWHSLDRRGSGSECRQYARGGGGILADDMVRRYASADALRLPLTSSVGR